MNENPSILRFAKADFGDAAAVHAGEVPARNVPARNVPARNVPARNVTARNVTAHGVTGEVALGWAGPPLAIAPPPGRPLTTDLRPAA